jgi:hypothetical protein
MLVSSRVVTVNLYSSGHLLNVSDLDDAINITLSTTGIENNLTDDEAACNHTACINRYDIAREDLHACSDLLESGSYSCSQHFCAACGHAEYCDKACGIGSCANSTAVHEAHTTSTCRLPAAPSCSYLDTTINRWRIDGEVIATADGQVTCGFKHLTEFAICLGPPPQTNTLASPQDTMNISQFFRDNPAGLIVAVVSLLLLLSACVCGVSQSRRRLVQDGRDIIHATLDQSVYVQRLRLLYADSWPILQAITTNLRRSWTCGSLWYPIEGDPMSTTNRWFVLCSTLNITLAVNLLFFQLGDIKEVCETTSGLPTDCSINLTAAEHCACRVCKSCVMIVFVPRMLLP